MEKINDDQMDQVSGGTVVEYVCGDSVTRYYSRATEKYYLSLSRAKSQDIIHGGNGILDDKVISGSDIPCCVEEDKFS